jgi:large subunit ribosomal protein L21
METGGKQYRVQTGDIIYIEKLNAEDGATVVFDKILAAFDEGRSKFGDPYLEGITVEGRVIKTGKGKKIRVYKYNAKKNYRRTQGHRQPYTKLQIDKIVV